MTDAAFQGRVEQARAVPIEREIERRGIKLKGKVERVGPCPKCGGDDRFAINTNKQVFNCRGCGVGGDVIALVQLLDGSDFTAACTTLAGQRPGGGNGTDKPLPPRGSGSKAPPAPNGPPDDDYEREQHSKAAWLWNQRRPIEGTPAERYLRGRGIICPLPPTLGYLPSNQDYAPTLIAAFGIPDEPKPGDLRVPGDVRAVHVTRLLPDGSDRERGDRAKIILGSPGGLPIVLAPPNDLLALAITEGIEDALALHEALFMGAWAAGSAGFLPKLAPHVPDWIETVVIEMHPDGGRRFAEELADSLRQRRIEVFVREAVA
jgi:hypothetical protein